MLKGENAMTDYLSTNFSPSMIPIGAVATIRHTDITTIPYEAVSLVRRGVLTAILSALLGRDIKIAKNYLVVLKPGDSLYCLLPNFGAAEPYDFNKEEVVRAGYKCLVIFVHKLVKD